MVLGLATVLLWATRTFTGLDVGTQIDQDTALRMLATTTTLFVSQTLSACFWESHYRKGMWRYVPMALLYPLYYWFVIARTFILEVSAAISANETTGSSQWERTARAAVAGQ